MGDFFRGGAVRAREEVKAEERGTTSEDFSDIFSDGGTDEVLVLVVEREPVIVVKKDLFDFDGADERFHECASDTGEEKICQG